jgi:hypothetical protein
MTDASVASSTAGNIQDAVNRPKNGLLIAAGSRIVSLALISESTPTQRATIING